MTYTKTNWQSGDIITSAKLNKIEDALGNVLGVRQETHYTVTFTGEPSYNNKWYEYSVEGGSLPAIPFPYPETISIIFDGVPYTVPQAQHSGLDIGRDYGADYSSSNGYDFTNFPFNIWAENSYVIHVPDQNEHTIEIVESSETKGLLTKHFEEIETVTVPFSASQQSSSAGTATYVASLTDSIAKKIWTYLNTNNYKLPLVEINYGISSTPCFNTVYNGYLSSNGINVQIKGVEPFSDYNNLSAELWISFSSNPETTNGTIEGSVDLTFVDISPVLAATIYQIVLEFDA